jgi:hypothetical protein
LTRLACTVDTSLTLSAISQRHSLKRVNRSNSSGSKFRCVSLASPGATASATRPDIDLAVGRANARRWGAFVHAGLRHFTLDPLACNGNFAGLLTRSTTSARSATCSLAGAPRSEGGIGLAPQPALPLRPPSLRRVAALPRQARSEFGGGRGGGIRRVRGGIGTAFCSRRTGTPCGPRTFQPSNSGRRIFDRQGVLNACFHVVRVPIAIAPPYASFFSV